MPMQAAASAAAAGWSTRTVCLERVRPDRSHRIQGAARGVLRPTLVAQQLHGVARFGRAELVFEDVAGELAKGRLEGRLAFENGERRAVGARHASG